MVDKKAAEDHPGKSPSPDSEDPSSTSKKQFVSDKSEKVPQPPSDRKESIPEVDEADMDSEDSTLNEINKLENEENVFQQLLGLPEISIETLYMQYKEKDKTIIKLMNEHTNFIQVHEGYPEFLNF